MITREQLQVGRTYTSVTGTKAIILHIGDKCIFCKNLLNGYEFACEIQDVLSYWSLPKTKKYINIFKLFTSRPELRTKGFIYETREQAIRAAEIAKGCFESHYHSTIEIEIEG